MGLIDTHAHLVPEYFNNDEIGQVLREAREQSVVSVINVATDLSSSHYVSQTSTHYSGVYAAVGLHPHDAKSFSSVVPGQLAVLVRENPKVVAIGEIGLDYHYTYSDRTIQQQVFRELLDLAGQLDLPVILHVREAWQDCFDIIDSAGFDTHRIVFHCFSGDAAILERIHAGSALISLTGMITFPKFRGDFLRDFPLERIMLETDCPYLAPVPHRGRQNRPGYLPLIAQKLAEIRHTTPEHIEKETTRNAQRFFKLRQDESL